jgi:diguanylate cyclase (GGDEF)-like protein
VRAANPLTLPLGPATAIAGVGTGAAANPVTHTRGASPRGVLQTSSSPAAVILHFISVIPTAVWIALAVAIGLAAMGGGAAVAFGRRASRRASEVAAVTASAVTDQLTGILNRRGFTETAERELERARRYGHPLALAYVDVRGLKAVNDTEGHLAGDRLLKEVAVMLIQSARTHDVVGRMGGDELAVLLAEQASPGAVAMSRRVQEQVPAHRASLGLSTDWDVTIGTASFPDDGEKLDDLLAAADRRLYEQRGIELRG